jgi:hypothetical protein
VSGLLPDGLLDFVWDRLPIDSYDLTKSCLAEDWFVEDALAAGSPFVWRGRDPETSHRLLYWHAHKCNIERGYVEHSPEWLLLQQMTVLLPVLFAKAAAIGRKQGIGA